MLLYCSCCCWLVFLHLFLFLGSMLENRLDVHCPTYINRVHTLLLAALHNEEIHFNYFKKALPFQLMHAHRTDSLETILHRCCFFSPYARIHSLLPIFLWFVLSLTNMLPLLYSSFDVALLCELNTYIF